MNTIRTLIISDIHLGCEPKSGIKNREKKLCELLLSQDEPYERLILLGDVFEFWMEYADFIPKESFAFLSTLKELSKKGIEIHYFAGNHDFCLGNFFKDQLGIKCHQDGAILNSGDKRFFFIHGDGLDPKDWKYRWAKKIIRNPFNQFLFKLLHPDWGMALARWVGSTSREVTGYDDCDISGYQNEVKSILERQKVDAVIHGHLHQHSKFQYEKGQHIITGQWLMKLNYTMLSDGEFELKSYEVD